MKTGTKGGEFRAHLIVYLYLHERGIFLSDVPVYRLLSGHHVCGAAAITYQLYGQLNIRFRYILSYRSALEVVREKQPHDDNLLSAVLEILERPKFELSEVAQLGKGVQPTRRGRSCGWKMALAGDTSQTDIKRFQELEKCEEFQQLMRLFPERKKFTAIEMAVTCPWNDLPPTYLEIWKRHYLPAGDETYKCIGKAVASRIEEEFVALARHGQLDQQAAQSAAAGMAGCARAVGDMLCKASQDEAARPLVCHLSTLTPQVLRLSFQLLPHYVKLLSVSPEHSELLCDLASSVMIGLVDALRPVNRDVLDRVCPLLPDVVTTALQHVIKMAREGVEAQQQQQQQQHADDEQQQQRDEKGEVVGEKRSPAAVSKKSPARQEARQDSMDVEQEQIHGTDLLLRLVEVLRTQPEAGCDDAGGTEVDMELT